MQQVAAVKVEDLIRKMKRPGGSRGTNQVETFVFDVKIELARTPTAYPGCGRLAFRCPDVACGRLVRTLFKSDQRIGCRNCLRLQHVSAVMRRSRLLPVLRRLVRLRTTEEKLSARYLRTNKRNELLQRKRQLCLEIQELLTGIPIDVHAQAKLLNLPIPLQGSADCKAARNN
jgi:hypothetical protein